MRFDLFLTSLSLFIAKFQKLCNRYLMRISRSGLKSSITVSKIKNYVEFKSYEFKCKCSLGTPEALKVVYGQRESRSVRSLLPFFVDFLNTDAIHILIS